MPAGFSCFLYKKPAYSFLVGSWLPGSIMDSVPLGLVSCRRSETVWALMLVVQFRAFMF